MSSILTQISKIAEAEGITITALEKKIGASKGVLSRALNNGSDIQSKWIQAVVENYPLYNIAWLITGLGSMLKDQVKDCDYISKAPESSTSNIETRPRIPMNAAAGALSVAINGITIGDCEELPVIKAFSKYDFTIFARGDSMEPEYHSGDELACLYIKNTNFVQWGRCHVLDTSQGIIVKRIFEEDEFIICKSHNSEYKDFSIHKSEVYNLALVIGMIRRY